MLLYDIARICEGLAEGYRKQQGLTVSGRGCLYLDHEPSFRIVKSQTG